MPHFKHFMFSQFDKRLFIFAGTCVFKIVDESLKILSDMKWLL